MFNVNGHTAEGKLTPDDMLSGSQICAVLGRSPHMTPNKVLKRALDFVQGIEPPKLDFEAMHWGSTFELPVLNEVAQRLRLGNPKTKFEKAFFHKDFPFAVSLDGMVKGSGEVFTTDPSKNIYCVNADEIKLEGEGILEVKVTSHEVEDDLPDFRGRIQLQAQMDAVQSATGKPIRWGAVGVLYRGIQLRIFIFERDEKLIQEIRQAAVDFDLRVQKFRHNGEADWYDFVNGQDASEVFDDAKEDTIELSDKEEDLAQRIIELEQDIKDMQLELEVHQAKIMARMGDYKYANAGRYHVKWGKLNYKPQPARTVPAKPARSIRVKKLRITEVR